LREKVKHIGTSTPSVVVSAKRSHFFGIETEPASYLSSMEYFNKTSRVSPPMTLRRFYGRSLMRVDAQLVFPNNLVVFTQTSLLCSPPSETRAMKDSDEVYGLCGDHYEHLVSRRNTPSVSLLVSSLHASIHHLVPYSAKIHGFTNDQQNLAGQIL